MGGIVMRKLIAVLCMFVLLFLISSNVYSHCQIPCGIYGDNIRIDLMKEHISTIEKSMNQINDLSTQANKNMNQLVRWVNNKDEHADKLSHIVTYYFLAQRIKIKAENNTEEFTDYQKKLTLLHKMLVFAMKSKQTTDLNNVG